MDTKTIGAIAAAFVLGATAGAGTATALDGEAAPTPTLAGEQAPPPDLVGDAAALVTPEQAEKDATDTAAAAAAAHRAALEAKHACESGDCTAYAAEDAVYHAALDEARFRGAVRERKAAGP